MAVLIEQYALGWHRQKGAHFRIKPAGRGWSNWVQVPAADLAALAAIFDEQPVYLQPDNSVTTGPEPIGQ